MGGQMSYDRFYDLAKFFKKQVHPFKKKTIETVLDNTHFSESLDKPSMDGSMAKEFLPAMRLA